MRKNKGSVVFQTMDEKEETIVRFLLKMLNLDENSCQDCILVEKIMTRIGVE